NEPSWIVLSCIESSFSEREARLSLLSRAGEGKKAKRKSTGRDGPDPFAPVAFCLLMIAFPYRALRLEEKRSPILRMRRGHGWRYTRAVMDLKQRSIEMELGRAFGAVLTPVRWVILFGIVASLHPRFGLEIYRPGVLAAALVYAALAAGLPRLRGRPFSSRAVERLLLAADVLFSAAIFYASGGIRGPYFALWYFALIHAALLLGIRAGVVLAGVTAALVVLSELALPGGRDELRNLSHAL